MSAAGRASMDAQQLVCALDGWAYTGTWQWIAYADWKLSPDGVAFGPVFETVPESVVPGRTRYDPAWITTPEHVARVKYPSTEAQLKAGLAIPAEIRAALEAAQREEHVRAPTMYHADGNIIGDED